MIHAKDLKKGSEMDMISDLPRISSTFTFAPREIRSLTMSSSPLDTARSSGVRSLRSRAFTQAPCSRRMLAVSINPRAAAMCNGPVPSILLRFTFAPHDISNATASGLSLAAAKWRGVTSSESPTSTEQPEKKIMQYYSKYTVSSHILN